MKYGEILDFRTKDKAVVGKRYFFSDILYNLIISPEDCTVKILGRVKEHARFPFEIGSNISFQFAREIIGEEPKYRPYKDTDEMVEDFKRRAEITTSEMSLPLIWVKSKKTDFRYLLSDFGTATVDAVGFSDLLDDYTYLDGSPCGIKEE